MDSDAMAQLCRGEIAFELLLPSLGRGVDGTAKERATESSEFGNLAPSDDITMKAWLEVERLIRQVNRLAPEIQQDDGPVQLPQGLGDEAG